MVLERPKKPNSNQSNSPAMNKPTTNKSKNNSPGGGHGGGGGGHGGGGGGHGGGGGGNQPPIPSPWLNADNPPQPHGEASFVEYLRWMRSPDGECKETTKLQILQMACQKGNYSKRLKELTERTKLIAQNSFIVDCPWRIRVGGHRGPESILLPAFDALGLPYIPASSLRGVARTQAIREIMKEQQIEWKEAEKKIAPWFGCLEDKNSKYHAGKVVFLDAYPLDNTKDNTKDNANILAVDMANNIWKWEGNSTGYSPNPNSFLSLEKPSFVIGLRLTSGCEDDQLLEKVKHWLITGLQAGIGSQVNTGYGQLNTRDKVTLQVTLNEFFKIKFTLEGQLIHGSQRFRDVDQPFNLNNLNNLNINGKLRPNAINHAEVRPVAFKSMLRYWFRTFALGVLEPGQVQQWEGKIFGKITPNKEYGWLMVRVLDGRISQREPQQKNDKAGEQEGILTLNYSPEIPENQKNNLLKLSKNLTWLMFHLGGIGQGARRPCYFRQNSQYRPWWRGSTLIPDREDKFWELPENPREFQKLFQQRLEGFYQALQGLGANFNFRQLRRVGTVKNNQWTEAIDANCKIIICWGEPDFNKPHGLAILHSQELKVRGNYDGDLCGKVGREVKPSPVWIADLDDYQVVTVFGANENPRKKYLQNLQTLGESIQLFPLTQQ